MEHDNTSRYTIPLPEVIIQGQPNSEEMMTEDPYLNLIAAKIAETWGSSVGEFGYGIPAEVAHRLYDALYFPSQVVNNLQQRQPKGITTPQLRDKTRQVLEAPVATPAPAPDRDEFAASIANTIVCDVDVAKTVLPGARRQLEQLVTRGAEIIVWSAGVPTHQYHKLGAIGLRDSVMMAHVEPPVVVSEQLGTALEITTAIATDKTTEENMARVAELAADREKVVIDDRSRNVLKFLERFPDAHGVWVRYGAHAAKTMERLEHGEELLLAAAIESGKITVIDDVDQVVTVIDHLYDINVLDNSKQLAAIFDLDDTLINNEQRRDMQHAAVLRALQEQNWI